MGCTGNEYSYAKSQDAMHIQQYAECSEGRETSPWAKIRTLSAVIRTPSVALRFLTSLETLTPEFMRGFGATEHRQERSELRGLRGVPGGTTPR